MRRGIGIAVVLLLVAQWCAWRAGDHRPLLRIEGEAAAEHLYADLDPGEFAGTLMLAGFRGLAIDILWMRAVRAKEAGRFYESVALFQIIAKTQPQFETVWEYMAWDMAYNIAAQVESEEAKFAWFLSGLEAATEGARRNPRGERLLRYLAWMFAHKGSTFVEEVEARDWQPLLGPLLEPVGITVPSPGSSPQALAAAIYRLLIDQESARGYHLPSFVRRIYPITLEQDGNLARNRGHHREALKRYLRALKAWQEALAWATAQEARLNDPDQEISDQRQARLRDQIYLNRDSYERLEGKLRRKSADLLRRLAISEDRGEALAEAVLARRFAEVETALDGPGWRERIATNPGIVWYDEQ